MKRSAELTPLSHDHHQALFVAQRLKRAEDASEARDRFLSFWRSHGTRHFAIEEGILLPGWMASDGDANHRLAARLAAEHLEIRTWARKLERGEAAIEELQGLGELLERHVRFEERDLFPLIEAGLDSEALSQLGDEIAQAEGRHGEVE